MRHGRASRLQGTEARQGLGRLCDRRQRLRRQELLQGPRRVPRARQALGAIRFGADRSAVRPRTSLSMKPPRKKSRLDVPNLGFGVGLRTVHFGHVLDKKPKIDWFEIVSENFMDTGGRPMWVLDQVA